MSAGGQDGGERKEVGDGRGGGERRGKLCEGLSPSV